MLAKHSPEQWKEICISVKFVGYVRVTGKTAIQAEMCFTCTGVLLEGNWALVKDVIKMSIKYFLLRYYCVLYLGFVG